MKKILLFVILCSLLLTNAYAGLLFTYIKTPVCATGSKVVPTKTGYASNYMLFGLLTIGDGSIKSAAESARIHEVAYVDSTTMALPFFLVVVQTTEVTGK